MNKINQEALAVKRAEQLFDRRRRTIGLFGGPSWPCSYSSPRLRA